MLFFVVNAAVFLYLYSKFVSFIQRYCCICFHMTATRNWLGDALCMKGYLPLSNSGAGACDVRIIDIIDDDYHH